MSNWLPIRNERGAGQCSSDSKKLDESTLNFMKGHSLKDEAVNNIYAAPLFVKTAVNERLTKIAVDPRVRTPADDNTYDVMYVGTTRGKVLKVISIEGNFIDKMADIDEYVYNEYVVLFLTCF